MGSGTSVKRSLIARESWPASVPTGDAHSESHSLGIIRNAGEEPAELDLGQPFAADLGLSVQRDAWARSENLVAAMATRGHWGTFFAARWAALLASIFSRFAR